ncbi:hypothetical protein F5D26_15660 [Burkholderia pseudomallei]|nr:hypothetical protein F5D26_15660 [Burkholderia pseudomallei]
MSAARGPAGRRGGGAAGGPCRPALPASRTRRTACATSRRIRHGASAPVGPVGGSPHARRARVRPAARLRRRVTRPARASACA